MTLTLPFLTTYDPPGTSEGMLNSDLRRELDVMLTELAAEDWRKLLSAGKESFTHALGRAVAAAGGSGVLARSATVRRGDNVVVFPGADPSLFGHCSV
jgi:hypothetical protein